MGRDGTIDLPSDEYLDIFLYREGDPPRAVEHAVLAHKYGDAPKRTCRVEPSSVPGIILDLDGRREILGEARTLAALPVTRESGKVSQETKSAIFEYPLPAWALAEPEHVRIWIGTLAAFRYDLFTEEHRRLFAERQEQRDRHVREQPATAR